MDSYRYEYGCLMLDTPIKNYYKVFDLLDMEDVYKTDLEGFGIEKEPHVTILYGFHEDVNVSKIKQILTSLSSPIQLKLTDISYFEAPEYDVLYFSVDSPILHRINNYLKSNFEYTSDYPDYTPHITISYLKKGSAKKYCRNLKVPISIISNKFIYSYVNGQKESFLIKNIYGMLNECDCDKKNNIDEYLEGYPKGGNKVKYMNRATDVQMKKDNGIKGKRSYDMGDIDSVKLGEEEIIDESKNKPTNPKLWSRAKSVASRKFDKHSAYKMAWASKWYKSKGGKWRKD